MSTEIQLRKIARNSGLVSADIEFGTVQRHRSVTCSSTGDTIDSTCGRYLTASITKPILAMAVLHLAAEGEFSLSERIGKLLPEFSKAAFRRITVRHLLTHTSGFADMLPNNSELRAGHAPLAEFVRQATKCQLDFSTGTECRYSSIGFLILGALIESIAGCSAGEYLRRIFFRPLQMNDTWLGLSDVAADEVLPTVHSCLLPAWQSNADAWGWNSRYWRMLGAPWGGLISSAPDLGKFARMLLSEGCTPEGKQILPANAVSAAFRDQSRPFTLEPGYAGTPRGWGFGWRQQWPSHHASFGDFVSPSSVGHWGATGTLLWIDPDAGRFAVFLTTTPYEQSQPIIQRMSNVLATR